MAILALIFLIPIFCIGFVIFVMSLFNYAIHNNLDVPLLTIGLFIIIILSFIIIKLFYQSLPKTAKNLNSELNSNTIYNLFTFFIMLLFGFTVFFKSFIKDFSVFDCVIGTFMITISLYTISNYFLCFENTVIKLVNIEDYDDKIKILDFEHQEYGLFNYYISDDIEKYQIDKLYKAKLNKKTKIIRTVDNQVHNIE